MLTRSPPPLQRHSDSLLIKDCIDTRIYILDHSSDVEVVGCRNVEIYIMRVVDGPALLEDCAGCKVVVASQQFQAKRCKDCWFGIYCATGPTLSESIGIKISPWGGELGKSLGKVGKLDPSGNQWLNVYDASEPVRGEVEKNGDGPRRNFELGFDPVHVRMLNGRNREDGDGDGDGDDADGSLMVFSSPPNFESKQTRQSEGVGAPGDVSGDVSGDVPGPDDTIKAIKAAEQWKQTIDLIDMTNNNNKHLTRFKSVLLSMTAESETTADAADALAHR